MDEEIKRLQEKIAHLEHHVVAQDRAMLELAEDIAGLRRELLRLRERLVGDERATGEPEPDDAPPERPPHY